VHPPATTTNGSGGALLSPISASASANAAPSNGGSEATHEYRKIGSVIARLMDVAFTIKSANGVVRAAASVWLCVVRLHLWLCVGLILTFCCVLL
jgi:hypothetical protein